MIYALISPISILEFVQISGIPNLYRHHQQNYIRATILSQPEIRMFRVKKDLIMLVRTEIMIFKQDRNRIFKLWVWNCQCIIGVREYLLVSMENSDVSFNEEENEQWKYHTSRTMSKHFKLRVCLPEAVCRD